MPQWRGEKTYHPAYKMQATADLRFDVTVSRLLYCIPYTFLVPVERLVSVSVLSC